ncbi:hydroxymethylbilane synthase [Halobacteriales archaeon Cl-PHB]
MSSRTTTIRLATRGSDLALRQAATVEEAIESRRVTVELVEVETTGDQIRDELIHRLGTTGAFVRSLDEKVLEGDVDAAVHSMKDVPTEGMEDLVVAGVPERATPGDVLLTPDGTALDDLPDGATVGTSSLRRGAQLLASRPDLEVVPLRGNVDTRVEKLLAPNLQAEHQARLDAAEAGEDTDEDDEYEQSVEEWFDSLAEVERRALEREVDVEFDAIVLAAAGLERTGLTHHVNGDRLAPTEFVPAPGQGALAITARDDEVGDLIHGAIDHPPTRVETTVERTILDELGGGCVAPVGIYARLQGGVVTTIVRVLSRDGTEEVRATRELPVESHATAAAEFAADLADQGAADLIAAARREEPDQAKREG